ncbi:hypothetical protein [Pseudofulvibacter geojedonensis]|uniref:Uncharacterized protein n=1 Tax=Pseudofulvibacter geojedonensis TaxID=1123758 RepID=A0ABW3I415_9FLAO
MKKNTNITLLIIIILVLTGISIYYFTPSLKKEISLVEKYPYHIGHINPETALLNKKHKLCGGEKPQITMYYSGAGLNAYKYNKKRFRETILSQYKNTYADSGYVNFRFLVNCEGKAGWFEIIEMDLNLELTDLDDNMVNQLLHLTAETEWNFFFDQDGKTPLNYYMYISYRIENGKITEIIP